MNRIQRRMERFSTRKKGDLTRKSTHKYRTNTGVRLSQIARGEE